MKNLSLRLKMFLFSFAIALFSIITSSTMMIHNISDAFEQEYGARAMAIARSVAQLSDIQQTVGTEEGFEVIQPIVERIRLATDVDYIVVFDMDNIRYTHPSESRIGTPFEGSKQTEAIAQNESISKAFGVQGFSIRAFVPIINVEATKQVGVINVGIISPKWYQLISAYQYDFFIALLSGIFIALLGSVLVANHLKRQTLNLEPYEIARIVQERSSIMQAMDVGLLAVDEKGNITFINHLARKYLHFFDETANLNDIFDYNWISEELVDTNEHYHPLLLFDQMYLIRTFPILIADRNVGYVIMLTNRKEAHILAEELTGIRTLVDSLRAQQHEYMNRLHSIAGLIQLERNEDALSLIISEISDEEELLQKLRDHILDYSVQGLLLGKSARAKELAITFILDDDSYLEDFMPGFSSGDLVTILGNLIDNAMEACLTKEERDVSLLLQGTRDSLYIEVQDNGVGIDDSPNRIFEYGFTTKDSEGHGIGLALVKQLIDSNKGTIEISSIPHIGTTIIVQAGEDKS